jgi:proteasome accessory factor A
MSTGFFHFLFAVAGGVGREFVSAGHVATCVPGAEETVACWRQSVDMRGRRDLAALPRRCDWALKYLVLDRQRSRRGLSWTSPEIKCLDLRYASVDPAEGLFLQLAAASQLEAVPTEEEIRRCVEEPPEESRAWLRAHALRRFGEDVADVDWHRTRFRTETERYRSPGVWMAMSDPLAWGRQLAEPVLARWHSARELAEAVGGLPHRDTYRWGGWSPEPWGQREGSYSWSQSNNW